MIPAAQAEGLNPKAMGTSPPHLIAENAPSTSVIVHDIPCTNRFSPLGIQVHFFEQGRSILSPRLLSQQSITALSQEEVVSLIIGLKEEVKELKQIMVKVSNTLRSISLTKDIVPIHKEKLISTTLTPSKQGIARNEGPSSQVGPW
ncbi:hypothetical protein NDU88_001013 [Pleurodeles waltl]|uniref:Uncharacterized protein n=1 Tax=Pleurodeles waltl TaxID=8319 RepID=A0AAV7V8A6_PLEWA|nr:hypothetical protein NDU88_001013 [Pleurodeles waltl]